MNHPTETTVVMKKSDEPLIWHFRVQKGELSFHAIVEEDEEGVFIKTPLSDVVTELSEKVRELGWTDGEGTCHQNSGRVEFFFDDLLN